jgi:hypothetical protein
MSGARGCLRAALAATLALALVPASGAAALAPLEHLAPGEFADVHQTLPVTVVLVGLEPGDGTTEINARRLLEPQLAAARLVDRTTRFYEKEGTYEHLGLEPSATGLSYDYDYRAVFADQAFEDAFFGYLASIAIGPIPGGTVFQQAYSAHPLAARPIPASYLIDATAAERWLAANAGPMLGVDTTRPTVFFVNWFGRPGFRFHTYAFLGQRPGTAFPMGRTHVGQMVAWGGSPPDTPYGELGRLARVWFYDLSAGPDAWTANWLLGPADYNGDGVTDERIPPIWEYGTDHWFRPFDDLTGDLARLLRYVAVDALFGAAPLYDPALSEPLLADRVELDLNLFAGRPERNPAATLRITDLPGILRRLDPTRSFPVDAQVGPLDGLLGSVFDCQQTAFGDQPQSCYGNRFSAGDGDPLLDLDFFFSDHDNEYLDGTRYELPLAVFDVPDSRLAPRALAGLASLRPPNLQGWTYAWLADRFRAAGATDTGAVAHETGHHLGLSHVHDTYDPGLDAELTPTGPFAFMSTGNETHTVMSYLPNTDEFGQFDRDHMARWQLVARLDNANRILGAIASSPRADRAGASIAAADAKAGQALNLLKAWELPAASSAAADAYGLMLAAAAQAGVPVEPFSGVADESPGAGAIQAATDPRDLDLPLPRAIREDPLARYVP